MGLFFLILQQVMNMTSKDYAAGIRNLIEDCCTHEVYYYYPGGELYAGEDHGTSHISVVDEFGNVAAVTSSINALYVYLIESIKAHTTK